MEVVSVVVLSYNSAGTILDALESVKNQTYSKIELVLGDDCSPDNTVEIIERWLEKNRDAFYKVKFIKNSRNQGVARNLLNCFNACGGEYCQTLAGDDMLAPTAIEEKYKLAKAKNLPVVLSKVRCFGKNWIETQLMQQYMEKSYLLLKKDSNTQLRYNLMKNHLYGPMLSFFQLSFVRKMRHPDLRYENLDDWPFAIRLVKKKIPLVMIEKELHLYRISSGSLSIARTDTAFLKSCAKVIRNVSIPTMLRHGWIRDAKWMLNYLFFWQ